MSCQAELDELAMHNAFAERMGGADKVKRRHDGGRLTVRERIEKLPWTANACQKIVRFMDTAETFLPIVHLADCPGFLIGLEAERSAVIRHACVR